MRTGKRQLEQQKRQADLLSIVCETVPAVCAGPVHRGPCPFEEVEGETFEVHAREGFFWCSDCGREGDVIDWVMNLHGSSMEEAVQMVSHRIRVRDRAVA